MEGGVFLNLELRMTGGDVKLPIWGMSIKNRAKFQGYRAILERNRAKIVIYGRFLRLSGDS